MASENALKLTIIIINKFILRTGLKARQAELLAILNDKQQHRVYERGDWVPFVVSIFMVVCATMKAFGREGSYSCTTLPAPFASVSMWAHATTRIEAIARGFSLEKLLRGF